MKLVLSCICFSTAILRQWYLKLSPVNLACSAFLGCNCGLSSPHFYKSSLNTVSLHYACLSGSLLSFNTGMQVHKQKEVKRTRNTSTSRDYLSLCGTFRHRECPVAPRMHHLCTSTEGSSQTAGPALCRDHVQGKVLVWLSSELCPALGSTLACLSY